MYTFEIWFKIDAYRTASSRLMASDWHSAKAIAESMFGFGNVINVSMV